MSAALDIAGVGLHAPELIALRRVALAATAAPVLAALPGGFATRRKGHGQEVADVREYVAGDDIRHLDRAATARSGTLHVRQFQAERDRVCLLVADFRPAMLWGLFRAFRSVAAAEALALIGWRVVEEGGRVGLLALGNGPPVIVAPRGRSRGMLEVIGGLTRAHAQALDAAVQGAREDPPLATRLSPVHRITPAGSEVVIASGFDALGEDFRDELDRLDRRRVARLVLLTDASHRLPAGSYPVRLSDGRRARVAIAAATHDDDAMLVEIAGRRALSLDAGAAIEETARRIAAAFGEHRRP